jgi:dTDP-4-amino-4,6-dideoxygalactose transaminase
LIADVTLEPVGRSNRLGDDCETPDMARRATAGRQHFLGVSSPEIGDAEVEELLDTLRGGWLTTGPRVSILQDRLAEYLDVPFVRCLSSCTAGLTLALRVLGIGEGDDVLVPSMTFVSCANAVVHLGATPVLVDCDPATGLIDLEDAERRVTARTRAIMPVHLAGHPADLDAVSAFGRRYGVAVIEDAAHAIGAEWRGRRIGAHGNLTAFSFHATKNMTTFEGGALAIVDERVAERVERLSLHGLTHSSWARHGGSSPGAYDVPEPGFKFAMHDVSAAVGIHQLQRLEGWVVRRRDLADAYDARLAGLPLELPARPPAHARHAHHVYTVRIHPDAGVGRDAVAHALRDLNIGTTVHFRAIHLHTYYRDRFGLRPQDLPGAADWSARALTLPLAPSMTEDDVDDVGRALEMALG